MGIELTTASPQVLSAIRDSLSVPSTEFINTDLLKLSGGEITGLLRTGESFIVNLTAASLLALSAKITELDFNTISLSAFAFDGDVSATGTATLCSVRIKGSPPGNVFIGDSTTGCNSLLGSNNLFFGDGAGQNIGRYGGSNNVFIGYRAGRGSYNGSCAPGAGVFVSNNFAVGFGAGYSLYAGSSIGYYGTYYFAGRNNNFLGVEAGRFNTTGCSNNFFGYRAGYSNTTGCSNNFFGYRAGYSNTTGCSNNFFGYGAGRFNTTGSHNNFLGVEAGYSNTTGSHNNFLGVEAGRSNTTGCSNNFFGYGAGRFNTTGCFNNFFGYGAGRFNTTGGNNNFLGNFAGLSNTTGCFNNFLGNCAGRFNTTGCSNNFFGYRAGDSNTTGCFNNFLGNCAGRFNTTGSRNNFLGNCAGSSNTIGSNNTIIGNAANVATNSLSGVIAIGTGAIATESHQVVLSTANVLFRSTGNTFEIGASNLQDNLTVYGNISATGSISLSTTQFTRETLTSTTSVTATDVYLKVIVNGQNKYLRLFDVT